MVTTQNEPLLQFNYRTKRKEKKSKKENLVNFVDVKGWRAIGNKIGNYLSLSGFKWLQNLSKESNKLKEEKDPELTLFS